MMGLGIFSGALTAGFVSNTVSYLASFTIAVGVILFSFIMFRLYLKNRLSHRII
jgi:predicted MFS family arabinose efflux permease